MEVTSGTAWEGGERDDVVLGPGVKGELVLIAKGRVVSGLVMLNNTSLISFR